MPIKEFYLDQRSGDVTFEFSDDSTTNFNLNQSIRTSTSPSSGKQVLAVDSRVALMQSGAAFNVPTRKACMADAQKGALIQAPLWSTFASATVPLNTIVRHSNGTLLWCVVTGIAGASEPTFSATAAITDNAVTWVSTGMRTKLNTDGYPVPTVTSGTSITGLTETLLWSNQSKVYSPTCPNWINYASVSTQAWGFNDGGAANGQGMGVGLRGYNRVTEFRTDAPKFAIGAWNIAGNRFRVYVDGYLLEENPTPYVAGNPAFLTIDFNGIRQLRTVRIESAAATGLRSICVDAQSVIFPAKQSGPIGVWLSDSYGGTVSTYTDTAPDFLSERIARRLGIKYLRNFHLGSTGYVSAGTTAPVGTVLSLNPPTDGESVGYVFFAHSYNDTALSQSSISTNALAAWKLARAQYPNAFIVIFGPWTANKGPDANTISTDTTLQSAFATFADPKSVFFSIAQDPNGAWISGTGKWGTLTGTGNSDFYTGADNNHPSAPGKEYLIQRIVEISDAALSANGY